MRRIPGLSPAQGLALLASLTLVSCAEEGPGPQFANDPAATRQASPTVTLATPVPLPTLAAATPATVSDLLTVRGAPSRVYTQSTDALWAVTSSGEAVRLLTLPQDAVILDIDPAPGGERVAVLQQAGAAPNRETSVVVVSSSGEILDQSNSLVPAVATPIAGAAALGGGAIDWSPQGDRLLVSLPETGVLDIALNDLETASPVLRNDQVGAVASPVWAPTGEGIGFIAAQSEQTRTLNVVAVRDGVVEEIVDPIEGRFVVEFAWMPNGNSMLFTEGGELGGAVTGIDLWQVGADGNNRELVVSAGTVAPVARITNVKPSPDGRSVAYAVLIPGERTPQVDSVWVRDLDSRLGFRIPLPSIGAVNDIFWTDRGLTISVSTRASGQGRPATTALLQVGRDGSVNVLWVAPVSGGTPVPGTPAATPGVR